MVFKVDDTVPVIANTSTPDGSAILELISTTQGILIPSMNTTQRDNISLPLTNLIIFNTTTGQIEVNLGTPGTPNWSSAPDGNAIHDNQSGEINAITEKTILAAADIVIIEDSAASFAKKKTEIANLTDVLQTQVFS